MMGFETSGRGGVWTRQTHARAPMVAAISQANIWESLGYHGPFVVLVREIGTESVKSYRVTRDGWRAKPLDKESTVRVSQ